MNTQQVVACKHCGNKTVQEVEHQLTTREEIYDLTGEIAGMAENYYFLTKCKTCNGVSLYTNWEYDDNPFSLDASMLLYPVEKHFVGDVPKAIYESYAEAKKVEKLSPLAFSILIRRALEFICEHQGAKKKNLMENIQYLATMNIIPAALAKMADAIRLLGNLGAHSTEKMISADDAKALDEFFIALIEYVYVVPKKLKSVEDRIKGMKSSDLPS